MEIFVHHPDGWIYLEGAQIRLDAFLDLEPAYALPAPAIGRRDQTLFTEDRQWSDPDFDPAPFLARKAEYLARSAELDAGPAPTLAELKLSAAAAVDGDAEAARRRWITPGAGQAMAYMEKRREADAYQAVIDGGGIPADADYPVLANEVGIRAGTLADLVALVRARAAEWITVESTINRIRLQAKKDIDAAADAAAVAAVLAGIVWPAPA